MAKLENFNGSIELISGIIQKNNQDFALMEAHSVVVDEEGTRLDEKILELEQIGITDEDKLSIINEAVSKATEEVLTNDTITSLTDTVFGETGLQGQIQDLTERVDEVEYNDSTYLYQLAQDDYDASIVYLYRAEKDAEVIPPEEEGTNVISKIQIVGGGAGGGGAKITLDTSLCSPFNAISLYGKDAYIKYAYKFRTYDEDKNETGELGNCIAVWLVNGVEVSNTGAMDQEIQHTFNVSKYLIAGSNNVILRLSGEYTNDDGQIVTKTLSTKWTVNNIRMYATSTFKDTQEQYGTVTITYTAYGNVDKTIKLELNGQTLNDYTATTSLNEFTNTVRLPASLFSHGSHLLKIFVTSSITDTSKYIGNASDLVISNEKAEISAEPLVFDIMWVDTTNNTPIIKCAYDEVTVTQYSTTDFKFSVWAAEYPITATIKVDDSIAQILSISSIAEQTWSFRPVEPATHTITILVGNISKSFSVTVEELDIAIDEEKDSLQMDFNPVGRSNSSEDYDKYEYTDEDGNTYHMLVSDNFDWYNGGWQKDESGESVFCIKAGTRMTLDYPLFKANTLPSGQVLDPVHSVGKNFKLTFKALNCKDFDSTVMTCFQTGNTTDGDLGIEGDTDNTKSTGIGVVVKSQKATLSSSVKAMTVPYVDEEKISFEVNITNEDNFSEILMLLDADYSKGDIYSATESFVQTEPQNITFGSDDCDVYIYRFKAYNKYLTDTQIINNFILEKQNTEKMIEEYQKNQILNGQLIDPDLLAKTNPDLRILKITCDHFPTSKDKVKGCTIQQIYLNGRPEDNWTVTNGMIRGQGTSSMEYKTSALNFDMEGEEFHWTGTDGLDHWSTYYQMTPNDIGESYFNIKVNVASSENANNAQNADDYHNNQPYLRPCRKGGYMISENLDGVELEAYDASSKVRDTMKFYPVVVFVEETGDTPTYFAKNADGTTQMYFYACGDFGNSKKNSRAFGIDTENNPKECIVEIANNDSLSTRFKTTQLTWTGDWEKFADGLEFRNITALAETDSSYADWCMAATQRLWSWVAYTDTAYSGETGAKGRSLNTVLTEFYTRIKEKSSDYFTYAYGGKTIPELVQADILKIGTWGSFSTDTVEYRKAKFINEFEEYFEPQSAFYHYVYTERHTMIDNRAKNVFPHTEDGLIWDFTFGYDMDTAKGNDNTGYLTYDYGVEDTDRVNNADLTSRMAFNAADSVLWCNMRDLMFDRIAAMFANREGQDAWSSSRLIKKFEDYQAVKPIRLVMADMRMKYLRPYEWSMPGYQLVSGNAGYSPTADFIPRMLGTKRLQRKYFETYQEAYMSSKYAYYHSNSAAELDNIPVRIGSTSSTTIEIVPYAKIYVNLKMGNNTFNFRKKAEKNEVVSITLPSAGGDTEAEILSASLLKQLNNLSALKLRTISVGNAKKLQKLELGSKTSGYSNPNLTTVSFGTNKMLEYLDVRNCTNLTALTGIDQCISLKQLYTTGSIISNLVIANNGLLESAELNAVQVLWLKNLNYLTNLTLASYSNLTNLIIDNCPYLDSYAIINQALALTTLRATYLDWELSEDSLLSRIYKMQGYDVNNNVVTQSVLTGNVYVKEIGQLELNNFQTVWKDLNISYQTAIAPFTVTFVSDGKILYTVQITGGQKVPDPIASGWFNTPTKESTEQYHYTFNGWTPSLEDAIVRDTTINAVFTQTVRTYTISWYRDNTESSKIYDKTFVYGSAAPYDEDTYGIPAITGSGTNCYIFKGWNNYISFVNKDVRIEAIWEMSAVPSSKKALSDFSVSEIYAAASQRNNLTANYLTTNTALGQSEIDIQLGYLPTYLKEDGTYSNVDITKEELITENFITDGTNTSVREDINIFEIDRSWTLAIDFEFEWDLAATSSTNKNVLLSCFDSNNDTGFMLFNYRNGRPQILWNNDMNASGNTYLVGSAPTATTAQDGSVTYGSTRDMLVLRHVAGESVLHIYFNNRYSLDNMIVDEFEMSSEHTTIPITSNARLTLGGYSYYYNNTWRVNNNGVGKLHYVKLWYGDIGEDECKKIANWIYKKQTFQYIGNPSDGDYRYTFANDQNLTNGASFISKELLDGTLSMGSASSGGFAASSPMYTWLQNKFLSAMPVEWRQIIMPINFYTVNSGDNTSTIKSTPSIYLPTRVELGDTTLNTSGMEAYQYEGTQKAIRWLSDGLDDTSNRIKRMSNGDGNVSTYWTASIDVTPYSPTRGNWYSVDEEGNFVDNSSYTSYGTRSLGICPCFSI